MTLSSPTWWSHPRPDRGSQGSLVVLWSIKFKPMAVDFPLGIWLVRGWWFYLEGCGWNWGWWCWVFRRVAALNSRFLLFLQPPDPLLKGALVAGAPMFGMMSLKKRSFLLCKDIIIFLILNKLHQLFSVTTSTILTFEFTILVKKSAFENVFS